MVIRATINLSLDDEAGDQIEKIMEPYLGSVMSDKACEEELGVIVEYIKRLADKSLNDIKSCVVNVEDIW